MDKSVRLGAWLFKKRDYTPIPLILLAVILIYLGYIRPTAVSVAVGVASILIGEAVRFWGVSHIGGISRTRTNATGILIDGGPFSLVRNPLYVGNFFLSLGFVMAAGAWILVPVYIALFAFQYHYIVQWEEWNLREKFGEPYVNYCKEVPRWVPRITGYRQGESDFGKALKSERVTLLAIVAVSAVLIVALRML